MKVIKQEEVEELRKKGKVDFKAMLKDKATKGPAPEIEHPQMQHHKMLQKILETFSAQIQAITKEMQNRPEIPAPVVHVSGPAIPAGPKKWTFTIERDEQGRMK